MKTSNRPPGNYCPLCDRKVVVSPKRNWCFAYLFDGDGAIVSRDFAHIVCPDSPPDIDGDRERVGR